MYVCQSFIKLKIYSTNMATDYELRTNYLKDDTSSIQRLHFWAKIRQQIIQEIFG